MGGSESTEAEVDMGSIKDVPENTQQYFKSSIYTQSSYPTRTTTDKRLGEITIIEIDGNPAIFKKHLKIEDHKKFCAFARNKQDRMKFDSAVFVKLLDYEAGVLPPNETEEGQYTYYINTFFEYIENDFGQILEERISNEHPFSSEEIEQPLKALLKAGEYLESIGSRHGDLRPESIMVTPDGQYKIMENIRDKVGTGQRIFFASGADLYISPQVFYNFCHGVIKNKGDRTKADVFSSGLIILQAAALQSIQDIFDKENGLFDTDFLEQLIDRASDNVSDGKGLILTLRRMLIIEEGSRPTFLGLKGGSGQSSQNPRPYQPQTHNYQQSNYQQGQGNPLGHKQAQSSGGYKPYQPYQPYTPNQGNPLAASKLLLTQTDINSQQTNN